MTDAAKPQVSSRKAPRQARSTALVSDILEAAVRVLTEDGAHRFTTARVAERAGVSVGSLYQYFPNKAAILFRLQSDEWQATGAMLKALLDDRSEPPLARLRTMVDAFVRSECAEADMRLALADAAPYYREAPEAQELRLAGSRAFQAFLREVLPAATPRTRAVAGDLVMMTLGDVGKAISERRLPTRDVERYAAALADMLCGYLAHLQGGASSGGSAVRRRTTAPSRPLARRPS